MRLLLLIIALLLAGIFTLQLLDATTDPPREPKKRAAPCYYGNDYGDSCPRKRRYGF